MVYLEYSDSTFEGATLDATDSSGYVCPAGVEDNNCYGAAVHIHP